MQSELDRPATGRTCFYRWRIVQRGTGPVKENFPGNRRNIPLDSIERDAVTKLSPTTPDLPSPFSDWFAGRGWSPHSYQLDLLAGAQTGGAQLLIAPTGGGKTLAGFLPSLIDLKDGKHEGLHTLYISPLKALAADIRRNLEAPIAEMALPIRVEDRTGDTKQSARQKQRKNPPHILLTTPESLALLLADPHGEDMFAGLRAVVIDEAHALAGTKRGDQLALGMARLRRIAPGHRRVGLSATVEDAQALGAWLDPEGTRIVRAPPGPKPDIRILDEAGPPPWSGMGGRYAARAVLDAIAGARTAIVFINTRAQAELFFQALWAVNDDDLPIGLHHGSLAKETRLKVEAAMGAGELRAVVSTSSLDLGIDWGAVDLVIQVGAPKGVARLVQRIGRANHQFDTPSRALLVPANRFDFIECVAAVEAVLAGEIDGAAPAPGSLDVLCQHILLIACAGPFEADVLYAEIRLAGAYRDLTREDFDRCLDFCATGGYALRAYDRWKRLIERDDPDGRPRWQLRDPRSARRLRMNVGTIVEPETLGVRLKAGRSLNGFKLGEVEEVFASTLRPGDSFMIGGEIVRYENIREMTLQVTRDKGREPRVPLFAGSRMPISTALADRVIAIMADPGRWDTLSDPIAEWLRLQTGVSRLPARNRLLVETFPCREREHTVFWSFAGRNAHQTLGLILTKRMEEAGLGPLGFVANDYALMIWSLDPVTDPEALLDPTGLREGLDRWLADTTMMKRTFRNSAVIAGLIERRFPGMQKSGKQATVSSDVLYDTLMKYDPDHLMIDITRREAMRGMVDVDRIDDLTDRIRGRIDLMRLARPSPLAAPLLLEVGREWVKGSAEDRLLDEFADAEAMMEVLAG